MQNRNDSGYEVVDYDGRPEEARRKWLLIAAVIVVFGVAGYFGKAYLSAREAAAREAQRIAAEEKAVAEFKVDSARLLDFASQWDAEVDLATRTSRIALPDRIAALQRLRRGWQQTPILTPCIEGYRATFNQSMETTIKGFLEFLSKEPLAAQTLVEGTRLGKQFGREAASCGPALARRKD